MDILGRTALLSVENEETPVLEVIYRGGRRQHFLIFG